MTPGIIMMLGMVWTLALSCSRSHYTIIEFTSLAGIGMMFGITHCVLCKSWLMNLSISLNCTIVGALCITFSMWVQNSVMSSQHLAVMFVVLLTIPHTLVLLWVGYSVVHYVLRVMLLHKIM